MTVNRSSIYPLNAGAPSQERARLNYNHSNLFKPLCGGLLPEHIRRHLAAVPSPRIADVATGTGIWLADLAGELPPHAELDGFDMDESKFAPREDLPANVTLRAADMRAPFPAELLGSYDVVHVRLVLYAMRAGDWEPVARNLAALLRPGGWLLWEETGWTSYVAVPPSRAWFEYVEADMASRAAAGADLTYVYTPFLKRDEPKREANHAAGGSVPTRLFRDLERAGLASCDHKIFATLSGSDEVRKAANVGLLAVMRQALVGVVARGGVQGMQTLEDVERLDAAVRADVSAGTMLGMNMWWTWGQRPGEAVEAEAEAGTQVAANVAELPGCGCCGLD